MENLPNVKPNGLDFTIALGRFPDPKPSRIQGTLKIATLAEIGAFTGYWARKVKTVEQVPLRSGER